MNTLHIGILWNSDKVTCHVKKAFLMTNTPVISGECRHVNLGGYIV